MANAHGSRVLLCADGTPPGDALQQLLEQAGHAVTREPLASALADVAGHALVVLDGSAAEGRALPVCRRLRGRLTESFVPILLVLDDPSPAARLASLEAGADTYLLRPFAAAELLAQVAAFLRLKDFHDKLADKTAEVRRVNQRLQQTYQQIDAELELARRIQRSFLPQQLPETGAVRFAVHYRPCARVGGDFYDVFRLDEHHVGFYVADAMGHGMPASLLTIFIKKGVRAKEIFGSQYRLVPPDEVLALLNRDMIEQALSETPFITMVYGLFDCRNRTLRLARAGHPHPVYVPRAGEPVVWSLPGSLLGVFETDFPARSWTLNPGDRVLLYTDGLAAPDDGDPSACARILASSAQYRDLPLEEYVIHLANECTGPGIPKDDVTLLGMEAV